ncbi:MAG: hypothetical protein A3C36_03665 [Omnitrophica WOR_2 bacterium RIFCSPHIGHO2_02_FULL_52_10]|nr:MAG: hypothetical protein A3C36_03665 [Omnitrophica WOR_2 bacterium RIFCSPHIGHO2_02_FULL_52_10]
MSIINDALKKAQKSLTRTEKVSDKNPEPPVFPAAPDAPKSHDGKSISNMYEKLHKPRVDQDKRTAAPKHEDEVVHMAPQQRSAKNWVKIALTAVVILAFAAGGFYLAQQYAPFKNIFASLKKSSRRSGFQFSNAPAKKRKYKPGELVLNGTSLIDGRMVALINDEIYEAGDVVNGMSVINIEMNKVELADDQKITTLHVR